MQVVMIPDANRDGGGCWLRPSSVISCDPVGFFHIPHDSAKANADAVLSCCRRAPDLSDLPSASSCSCSSERADRRSLVM